MSLRLLTWILTSLWVMGAEEISLVRVGETWRYNRGFSEPSPGSFAWAEPAFNDDSWPAGSSGFASDAYYSGTYIRDAAGCVSLYYRNTFTLADPTRVQCLVLRIDYQDAFVAYLNGREIARAGAPGQPGQPVPFDAPVGYHAAGVPVELDASQAIPFLTPGENVLAIQGLRSVQWGFGFSLTAELLANFIRGPFLQNVSTNQAHVLFTTPLPVVAACEYGPDERLGSLWSDLQPATNHVARLTNLAAGTRYYYRIQYGLQGRTAESPLFQFRTLKDSGDFSFLALGDSGQGNWAQKSIARVMEGFDVDLIMHLGDVVYPSFVSYLMDLRCLSVYGRQLRTVPLFINIGNHERYANPFDYPAAFDLPTNSLNGSELFYSFDHGDAHFTVLDTDVGQGNDWSVGGALYRWLEADLAATTKPWKILTSHNPLRSSGAHRNDNYNFGVNPALDRIEFQESIGVLAARYGVQLVLNAHEHLYERLMPVDGVHEVISGGGGGGLYYLTQYDEASCQFWIRYNFLSVRAQGEVLKVTALGPYGEIFDTMTIGRAMPPPKIYDAAWFAPVVEADPANDGDGNLSGQTFNFAGGAIPTVAGKFSNFGSLYVNNDDAWLYIGLEQAMLYPSNYLALFIESPRLPGVANLWAAGNGVEDPWAQGVDGLDHFANLSFTNFNPAVGCLLGDEFADGQDRHCNRPGMASGVGQGIFYLDAPLNEVPGVRLQQFNRSPQRDTVTPEQNADFIELAIPLVALGGLRPGDVVKIGAVAAGQALATNEHGLVRWLDTSFAGQSLAFDDAARAGRLEGVAVRLAGNDADPGLDSDHDGLTDRWRATYGLGAIPTHYSRPGDDPDRDGMTNLQEQQAGTHPLDASSRLRIWAVALSADRLQIHWDSVPGKKYALDWADDPQQPFQPMGPDYVREAGGVRETLELDLTRFPTRDLRLFKIRIVP
jgi:hypothetical protein